MKQLPKFLLKILLELVFHVVRALCKKHGLMIPDTIETAMELFPDAFKVEGFDCTTQGEVAKRMGLA